jgi:hypothetical protein
MDLKREKYKNSHPTVEVDTYGPLIDIGKIDPNGRFNNSWESMWKYADQIENGYSNFDFTKRPTGLKPESE